MKDKRYFVDFFAYFGEVDHEEFSTLGELEAFKSQLRKGSVLASGEIKPVVPAANYMVAAA
jgi:hypothetical protein